MSTPSPWASPRHHQRRSDFSDSSRIQSLYLESDQAESTDHGKMQSLSSQIAFGRYGSDTLRPSMSFDCLGSVYDQHFTARVPSSPKVGSNNHSGKIRAFLLWMLWETCVQRYYIDTLWDSRIIWCYWVWKQLISWVVGDWNFLKLLNLKKITIK